MEEKEIKNGDVYSKLDFDSDEKVVLPQEVTMVQIDGRDVELPVEDLNTAGWRKVNDDEQIVKKVELSKGCGWTQMRFIDTFGGAVTHLSDKFETFELSKKQAQIKKYIDDNPGDLATKVAWDVFLEGTQKKRKKAELVYYLWKATDLATGKEYHATSSEALGKQIGASKSMVGFACRNHRLVKGHYQITREASKRSKNIWIAKNQITQAIIVADTAEQLAVKIGAHTTTVVNYRRDHRLVHGRYSITREKRKKAQ